MTDFNPDYEVKSLKKNTKIIRKPRYSRSRLDRYKGELIMLKSSGATCAEIQRFLRDKRIKVVYSTVSRWLAKNG